VFGKRVKKTYASLPKFMSEVKMEDEGLDRIKIPVRTWAKLARTTSRKLISLSLEKPAVEESIAFGWIRCVSTGPMKLRRNLPFA
jgi:hypothetical protein